MGIALESGRAGFGLIQPSMMVATKAATVRLCLGQEANRGKLRRSLEYPGASDLPFR